MWSLLPIGAHAAEKTTLLAESATARSGAKETFGASAAVLTERLSKLTEEAKAAAERHRETEAALRKKKDKVPKQAFPCLRIT